MCGEGAWVVYMAKCKFDKGVKWKVEHAFKCISGGSAEVAVFVWLMCWSLYVVKMLERMLKVLKLVSGEGGCVGRLGLVAVLFNTVKCICGENSRSVI